MLHDVWKAWLVCCPFQTMHWPLTFYRTREKSFVIKSPKLRGINVEGNQVIEYLGHLNELNIRKDIRTREAEKKRKLNQLTYQGYLTLIFGKYLFGRRFEIQNHLEFSGAFFLAEILEKVSFDPYNYRITRLSARKSEQMKNFQGIKICLYLPLKY